MRLVNNQLQDDEFGTIALSTRANMRRITARWRNDVLSINLPVGIPLRRVVEFIDENRDKLRELRDKSIERAEKSVDYHLGQQIPCFRGSVLIAAVDCKPNTTGYQYDTDGNMRVVISSHDDITTEQKKTAISGALKELMKRLAPKHLIPYAQQVAKEIGTSPLRFEIGRGMRKLGHCTTGKVIQLSYNLMFMPEELVRYIICHELAHLTEMNHSPRFHALCDRYCSGKEKALERKLKGFIFPILK